MSKFQNDTKQYLSKMFKNNMCFLEKTDGGNYLQILNFIIAGDHK